MSPHHRSLLRTTRRRVEMLRRITVLIFLIAMPYANAVAETLRWEDYLGQWEMIRPTKEDSWVRYFVVEKEKFSFCAKPQCDMPYSGTSIETHGDVVILSIYKETEKSLTVVFSGFRSSVGSSLMGTRYHYYNGSVISGLPMFYRKIE